jgi:hypothetical protein
MDRQARTGDTVTVKSREMTGRSQTLHAVFFILTIFPSSKLLHSCLTAYFRSSFFSSNIFVFFVSFFPFHHLFLSSFYTQNFLSLHPETPSLYFIFLFFLHFFSLLVLILVYSIFLYDIFYISNERFLFTDKKKLTGGNVPPFEYQ